MSTASDLELAIRAALHYLGRASDSWRNGDAREPGPLHWPVAVREAKRALEAALVALRPPPAAAATPAPPDHPLDTPAARAGMAWYNSITPTERARWHMLACSARPADAYAIYLNEEAYR